MKSAELITQILTENKICNCIEEPSTNMTLTEEEKEKILESFILSKNESFEKLIRLSENFELTNEMVGDDMNILTKEKLEGLKENNKYGMKYWNWMNENCPKGKYFISKPIFNEKFNRAFIFIGIYKGVLNGSGGKYIYELENGVWKSLIGFDFYIS